MNATWWKRLQYALEATAIFAFVPFALYPSPITLLVLATLPAGGLLLFAAVCPGWLRRKPTLIRYSHVSATISACTAVVVGGWFAIGARPSPIHLLSAGYRGPVTVVFRCPFGRPPAREGLARVYKIPESGVLLVPSDFEGRQPRIRLVSPGGATGELPWVDAWPTSVAAFSMRAASWSRRGPGPTAIQYVVGDHVQWSEQTHLLDRARDDADAIGATACTETAPPN